MDVLTKFLSYVFQTSLGTQWDCLTNYQWWLHVSARCPQDFSQLPPASGSSSIPILSLKLIPSEQSNWYFCLCIILVKAGPTGVTLANTPGISQPPLEPASCTELSGALSHHLPFPGGKLQSERQRHRLFVAFKFDLRRWELAVALTLRGHLFLECP